VNLLEHDGKLGSSPFDLFNNDRICFLVVPGLSVQLAEDLALRVPFGNAIIAFLTVVCIKAI